KNKKAKSTSRGPLRRYREVRSLKRFSIGVERHLAALCDGSATVARRNAALLASTSPRMVSLVQRAQPGARDVRVDLRRRDVGVAQHGLERPEVRAVLEQVRGEGVPERVGRDLPAHRRLPRPGAQTLPEVLARHWPPSPT